MGETIVLLQGKRVFGVESLLIVMLVTAAMFTESYSENGQESAVAPAPQEVE